MWKNSLRIGIESIDKQHKALFDKSAELLAALGDSRTDHKQECIDAVSFLKDYTARHFADEEAYQQSIGYKYFSAHKKLHDRFIASVLEHEQRMKDSDYAESDIKAFIGMLIAWLLYHIADADQKIGKEEVRKEQFSVHYDMVVFAICDVLSKMAGYDFDKMQGLPLDTKPAISAGEVITIEMEITGSAKGFIVYTFPVVLINELIHDMMGYTPNVVGELELSALFEIVNIVTGTVCREIAFVKGITCDISTPFLVVKAETKPDERIAVDIGRGIYLEAGYSISYDE